MRPKGSVEALEVRRRIAAKLLQEGKGIREVARLVGAGPSAVHGWKQALAEGGPQAVEAKPHPGRPAQLTGERKTELERVLLAGPLAAGFPTDLWSLTRGAQVIERHFGVKYHPGDVGRVLRGMGWSPQEPERRARERDEEAVERWRKEDWPRIKKSPPRGLEHRPDRREWLHAPTCGAQNVGNSHPIQLGSPGSSLGHRRPYGSASTPTIGFVLSIAAGKHPL